MTHLFQGKNVCDKVGLLLAPLFDLSMLQVDCIINEVNFPEDRYMLQYCFIMCRNASGESCVLTWQIYLNGNYSADTNITGFL